MLLTIVPGIGGSGSAHWQSIWEADDATAHRIAPSSWDEPDLGDWLRAIDDAVELRDSETILIAHSLGTLAVAEWLTRNPGGVAGALLVAPPDRFGPEFPAAAPSFLTIEPAALGVPALVVASDNDPYCEIAAALELAAAWDADFANVGSLGHINTASDLGGWDAGRGLLEDFVVRVQASR